MPKKKTARRKRPGRKPGTASMLQELNDVTLEMAMDIGAIRATVERLRDHFTQPPKEVVIEQTTDLASPEAEPDQVEAQPGDSPQPPVVGG